MTVFNASDNEPPLPDSNRQGDDGGGQDNDTSRKSWAEAQG